MKKSLIAVAALAVAAAGCTTNPYTGEQQTTKTARNAAIGAAAGAVIGAVVGNNTGGGNATRGAIIGATTGGLGGGAIGIYQDRQEARLRQELASTGVRVQRNGNDITLIMPGNITFETAQANIQPSFYAVLNSVAKVIVEFDQTRVLVEGHTDSRGTDEFNDQLSVNRAVSVGNYLASQGVSAARIDALGYGERQPIATNDTESGRAANRRVEIDLVPIQQ